MEREISHPRIDLHASRDEDQIRITVQDNAGGISDEIQEKIFEPYFSTKAEKGTGIGLYMVRTILEEKFGGSISVKNAAQGALFEITLPCAS